MELIHKLIKNIYDGNAKYFVANKDTDKFGYYSKDEVEQILLSYGSDELIIFKTCDQLEIETKIQGLEE